MIISKEMQEGIYKYLEFLKNHRTDGISEFIKITEFKSNSAEFNQGIDLMQHHNLIDYKGPTFTVQIKHNGWEVLECGSFEKWLDEKDLI